MPKSSVVFGLRDFRIPVQYDHDQLRLGSIVYVKFSDSGEPIAFSSQREEGVWTRFAVTWISPSEWYVPLVERYEPPAALIESIKVNCGNYIDDSSIKNAISKLADQIRIEHLYKTRTRQLASSFVSIVLAVTERLDLCRKLKAPSVEKELFHHQHPLLIYLYLTCFDLLGQPADWLDYGAWLHCHHHKQRRELAVSSLPVGSSADDISKATFYSYCGEYGVKAGFFNFINRVLPSEQRSVLLNSILISNCRTPPSLAELPRGVAMELTDFSVFYSQDSIANAEASLKDKASKIVVEKGQIVKVSKDKNGIVNREVLTKKWTDWIDYWAVDFNFESKREIVRVKNEESGEWEERWTGDYIFENEWQSFRTKKDRSLELTSVFHECAPGRRKLAVKVVDIFGNDTMTIVEVTI